MKTASEIRALMYKDDPAIPRMMTMLEEEIVKAAKMGFSYVVVFVSIRTCNFNCATNVKGQMHGLGYECKTDYIVDKKDGGSHRVLHSVVEKQISY